MRIPSPLSLPVLSLLTLSTFASAAQAQAPVTAELVLEPLVVTAQADLERGDVALALARASAAVASLPPETALAVRASGLVLLASQRLAGAPPSSVDMNGVLTPLVDAAELDGVAGRLDLARARLDLVIARVPATAALAVRASGLRAGLVAAPVPAPPPQQVVVVGGPAGAGVYVAPTSVYTVPSGVPAATEPAPARRRGAGTNWSLVAPGIGLLAGGWVIGWLTTLVWSAASVSCTGALLSPSRTCTVAGPFGDAILQMLIPLIGPWWTIGSGTYRGNDVWFPGLMGVLQPVGLILLIVGLATPERHEEPPTAGTVRLTPTATGLVLDGWF